VFWFILRIEFCDKSILVSAGPFRNTSGGISLSLLCERFIVFSLEENDKSPASIFTILLSDKSSMCSWLRLPNKLLDIVQMPFPERNNRVTDVRPRRVVFEIVILFPDRFSVVSVVLLANNPPGSCRRRFCERSSDWSRISGKKAPTERSLKLLTDRFSVAKKSSPFRLCSFKFDSRLIDKSSWRSDVRFLNAPFASMAMSFLSRESLTSCFKLVNVLSLQALIRLPASDNSVILVEPASCAGDHIVSRLSSISSFVS